MALQSGITLYDQIKSKVTGTPTGKAGFFDFGTVSLGVADPSLFTEPSQPIMDQPFTPEGMVPEQVQGGVIGELDFSKGMSPSGFYQDIDVQVGMPAATAPGGMATTTETRTQQYSDEEAAAMLGIAPPQTAADYAALDAIMANIGTYGAYDYSRSQAPVGSIGATRTTEAGRQAQSLFSTMMGPLGIIADATMGDQYVGLGGRMELESFGLAGLMGEKSYREAYEIAKQEARGVPGYNVYVSSDGQLRGYKPAEGLSKLFGQEFSAFGTADLSQVRNEVALAGGFDPATFDFNTGQGVSLEGMVTGFGGFAQDGSFVNMAGERSSSMNHGYTGMQYGSAVADVYGTEYAVGLMNQQADRIANSGGFFSQSRANYYSSIADQLSQGVREQYSFGTGTAISTGGYVRSSTGQPVRSKDGFVYAGRMYTPEERSANLSNIASGYGFDMDRGRGDPNYGTGSEESEGVGYDPGFDEGDT